MTETLLGLIPTYGVWFVLGTMILSCLAMPIPAAILVMTAGGFAASEDMVFWQVILSALLGYVIGDQLAYNIARLGGAPLLARMQKRPKITAVFGRAETLLHKHGTIAVFLSRTILSPLSPYVGYLSGALGMNWLKFTGSAFVGAAIWSSAYTSLGYIFASRIGEVAALISSALGFILAGFVLLAIGYKLTRSWRAHKRELATSTAASP